MKDVDEFLEEGVEGETDENEAQQMTKERKQLEEEGDEQQRQI